MGRQEQSRARSEEARPAEEGEIPLGEKYYVGLVMSHQTLAEAAPKLYALRMNFYPGAKSGRVPFHLSLFQPFTTPDIGVVVTVLERVCQARRPFAYRVEKAGDFGPEHGVVWVGSGQEIDTDSPLVDLHLAVVEALDPSLLPIEKLYPETRFEGREGEKRWGPHFTLVADLAPGEVTELSGAAAAVFKPFTIVVDSLTLFSKQNDGSWETYPIPFGTEAFKQYPESRTASRGIDFVCAPAT